MTRAAPAFLSILWVLLSTLPLPAQSPTDALDFNRDIRPILADRCFACHGPDAAARKARLRLDTFAGATKARKRGAAIVPGDPDRSLLMQRIRHASPKRRMPPPASKLRVTADEVALLARWIRQGARYADHWSFRPVTRPALPAIRQQHWPRDPLDRLVLAALEARGASPAPEADRATWLRRASFALTGLAPTLAAQDAFLADSSADAYERVVDRLLGSPHYGERMAVDWLDVARYADTYGYQSDVDRRVWPYRDWVIRAFQDNLSYDRFLTWQIAGDLLPNPTRDQRLATAFQRLHRQTNEGGSVEEEFRVEYVADRTETTATAFMGLTLGCARCHDHKFDPISQQDYYSLTAFFDNIDESGLYSHFTNATPTPTLSLPSPAQERELAALRRLVRDADAEVAKACRGATARFERWCAANPEIPTTPPDCEGHYPLDDLQRLSNLRAPDDPKRRGRAHDGPRQVPGVRGAAVLLDGEDNLSFPGGNYGRSDAFSFAVWLKVQAAYPRAVVFHKSRAWTDAGSRGYQLLVENGRLSWSLIHFWPGNAIRVKTLEALPRDRWCHVVVTYDGSSRAAGLRIFVDGAAAPLTTVRDHLTRTIRSNNRITIGQRFRDKGLVGGAVDEFQFFRRALTDAEARWLSRRDPGDVEPRGMGALPYSRDLYCSAYDPDCRAAAARRTAARAAYAQAWDRVPQIMSMVEMEEPRQSFLLARGSYEQRAHPVQPRTPTHLPPMGPELPRNRLGLARWMLQKGHPLTARVAVNRLWHLVFGAGLVPTLENFGTQGTPPAQPELLDFLADEFVASGWDIQAMLRRLVLSATFRQSSRVPRSRAEDPDNRLLRRGPSYRLPAEMLRDHALHASGLLVDRRFGPSVKPYQPPGLWKEKSGKVYRPSQGEGLFRRSLYTFWKRTSPPPSMMIFDAAKRDVCVVRRQQTNTPLQALVLLNDPQFVEASRALATRILHQDASAADRLSIAFRRLASRPPTSAELAILTRLLAGQERRFRADPRAAQKFLAIGTRAPDPGIPAPTLAAYTTVVGAILNSDAAIMLR